MVTAAQICFLQPWTRSLKCLQLQLLISEMALKAHPIAGLHGMAGIQTNQMSPAES